MLPAITNIPSRVYFSGSKRVEKENKNLQKDLAEDDKIVFIKESAIQKPRLIDVVDDFFEYNLSKIIGNPTGLSKKESFSIKKDLEEINDEIEKLETQKLQLGRLMDYDALRKKGFTAGIIKRFVVEDNNTLKNAQEFIDYNTELRERMFGYPANMTKDSAMTKFLRRKEAELPLINNCGDPYDVGNYLMDSKICERALLDKLYNHFGLNVQQDAKPWGYITTGGSESNKWGIHNGLRKFPNGRVYYSEAAHYSVGKSVKIGFDSGKDDITLIKHSQISLKPNSEKIDTDILLSQIRKNWETYREPAILLLTFGTTKTGALDDVELISKTLKDENIPHYIHLDAALFGGVAKNQINAPKVPNIEKLGIDSISVSLHKFFGNHDVKSVVISRQAPNAPKVDYIGQYDSTTAGSRTFNPFSSLQRINETLDRAMPNEYCKNVLLFESMLDSYDIKYSRAEDSNIFVIDEPSAEISKKYQLSDFEDNGEKKSHIIIFPYHKPEKMRELVNDLSQDIKIKN